MSEGSIDCPDCQLLQQQQLQQQSQNASQNIGVASPQPETTHNNASHRNDVILSHHSTGEVNQQHLYQLSSIQNARVQSSMYSYGSGEFLTPSSSSSSFQHHHSPFQGLSSSQNPQPASTPSTSSSASQAETLIHGSGIEPCDYNGYCSTCAVLDLPTNDKFYRSTGNGGRPHVFPPIFYSQGPSSVIPCFSPIPDWTNEYNHYAAYPGPFSAQSTSSNPSATDFFSGANMGHGTTPSGISNSNYESTSSMLQQAYHPQVYNTNARSESISSSTLRIASKSTSDTSTAFNTQLTENFPVKSISNLETSSNNKTRLPNSPSSSVEVSDSESSCDSDSMASDDRELISVVEDEDENECTKGVRPGGKCLLCQKPIEITDCSSPQLVKILENIEEGIAAEDLDITVSSGDIEIGGMEDEYGQIKKRHVSGPPPHGITSISRLASLMGISQSGKVGAFGCEMSGSDHDVAILCFRCGKLASMADTLERQLSTAIQALHHQLISSHNPQELSFSSAATYNFNRPGSSRNDYCELPPSSVHSFSGRLSNHKEVQTDKTFIKLQEDKTTNTEKIAGNDAESQCGGGEIIMQPNIEDIEDIEHAQNSNYSSLSSNSNISYSEIEDSIAESVRLFERRDSLSSPSRVSESSNSSDRSRTNPPKMFLSTTTTRYSPSPLTQGQNNLTHPCPLTTSSFEQINGLEKEHDEPILLPETVIPFLDQNPTLPNFSSDPSETASSLNDNNCSDISKLCQYCQRTCSTKSNLKAHLQICKSKLCTDEKVSPKETKCEKCGIGFRSAFRREKHMQQGCKAITFKCDHCQRNFSKSSELKTHLHIHLNVRPFKCGIEDCDKTFATKGNQIAHSRTHFKGTKKFTCNHCDKGFNRRFALTIHLNRHNGIKPFPCKTCGKSFSDPSNLNNHKKRSHLKVNQDGKD